MSWDTAMDNVKRSVRNAHREGCWDLLRAFLDAADKEPDHECQALEWARRLYADPGLFHQFVSDSQAEREGR